MSRDKKVIDWKFKVYSISDYLLNVDMDTKNQLIKFIFGKTVTKLKRTKNIRVDSTKFDKIDFFRVEPQYYNLLATFLKPVVRNCNKTIRSKHGIEILNAKTKDAWFKKIDEDVWHIKIVLTGQYAKKV